MLELLKKRRSIRKYQERSVEKQKVEIIREALLRCPSAKNLKSWEFVLVDDRALIRKLADARPGSSTFLAEAPLAIVIMGNEEVTDVWIEDGALATMVGHLTATSLDLGSCWIQIRNRSHDRKRTAGKYVKELLGIPERFQIISILAIGYPTEEKEPVPFEELPQVKIHTNSF